ncbi:hypothetical protein MJH12_10905 [bacterium]|nr:hypothetical protein [bacterium]
MLKLEKANKSIHYTLSWILIFSISLINLLPLAYNSGFWLLNSNQLTITHSIGISIFLSLLIGSVEYLHNGFMKHNKTKYILYASTGNDAGCNEVFNRVQEYYRESKVAISYKLYEDYKVEILFLACFYLITLVLSWLISFFAYTCATLLLLLYPVILSKLKRSRLFLGLRLVKDKKDSGLGPVQLILSVCYLFNFLLLICSIYYLIMAVPTINIIFLSTLITFMKSQPFLEQFLGINYSSLITISYFFVSLSLLAYLRNTGYSSKSKLIEMVNIYLMNSIFIFLVIMSYISGIQFCLIALTFYQMSLLSVIRRGVNNN